MITNFDDKKSNVIEMPRKIKWGHHVLAEADRTKSPPSQYLLDWWAAHPEQDPRKNK